MSSGDNIMTHAGWLSCDDINLMLAMAHSNRKTWFFNIACCRNLRHVPESVIGYLVYLEECLDGTFPFWENNRILNKLPEPYCSLCDSMYDYGNRPLDTFAKACRQRKLADLESRAMIMNPAAILANELREQADMAREIIGLPHFSIDAEWQSESVLSVAGEIYEKHSWQDMPVLADALEDTGCQNELILAHLRGSGKHLSGCWALDAILGKK